MTDDYYDDGIDPTERDALDRRYPITAAWRDLTRRTIAEIGDAVRAEDGADAIELFRSVYSTLATGIHSALFELEAQINDIRSGAQLGTYERDFGPWPVRGFGRSEDDADD